MSRLLGRLGAAAAAHPWRTLGAWLLALVALSVLSARFGGIPRDYSFVAGTEAQAATEFLHQHLPHLSGADARVVIHDAQQLDFGALEELRRRLADLPGASVVSPPRLSDDGDTALITVQYDVPATELSGSLDALRAAAHPLDHTGVQVAFGGEVAEDVGAPLGVAGLVGLGAALLVVGLGTVGLAALTLGPAVYGLLGRRRPGRTARWAAWIMRRPFAAAVLTLGLLAALAAPALGLRTWLADVGGASTSSTTRRADDLVAAEFGPGVNGPLVLVADLTAGVEPDDLVVRLRSEPGIARVPAAYIDGVTAIITVEPTTGPQDAQTTHLLRHLRTSVLPDGVLVTGPVARFTDSSDRLAARQWLVGAAAVGLSLVVLTGLFRAPAGQRRLGPC